MERLIKNVGEFKFVVHNKHEFLQQYIMKGEQYEPLMVSYIRKHYKGGIFIDAGSNMGLLTLPFSKIADIVYSFEPALHPFFMQYNNIYINKIKNIKLYCCALGNSNKPATLYYSDINTGSNSLYKNEMIKKYDFNNHETVICKLDDFKIENVKLIKIDVQGFELNVLKGAKKTIIKNNPDIFVECVDEAYFETIYNYLKQFKYKPIKVFNLSPTFLFVNQKT